MSRTVDMGASSSFGAIVLKWSLIFLGAIFIQVSLLQYIAIEIMPNVRVQPDIVLLVIVFFSMRANVNGTIISGFLSGLLHDLLAGNLVGVTAFSKTIAAFASSFLPDLQKLKKLIHFIILLTLIVLAHDLFYNMIFMMDTEIDYWRIVFVRTLPSTLYTVFIGSIVFYLQKN